MTTVDPLYESRDFSSFSNFAELEVKNIKLEWDLNFDSKVISGLVEHELLVKVGGVSHASFDTSNLTINEDIFVNGQKTTYSFGEKNAALGTPLHVEIPEALRGEGTTLKVLIFYAASPSASAVQWLEPGATKGKIHPYVFTQSQAIHARSLLPCMDSPGVKAPYSAIVTAPAWCTVLMSAVQGAATDISLVESPVSKPTASGSNISTFYWKQPVATSAYLIALVGGNLSSRDVSDRVRIWSEPDIVETARYEFAETEEFLKAAEDITGLPYQWGRYDVVCLPPSFPYGGMENPCLTFATPTLLAGDRSLADVIAHEIAHSWTGNLVTNSVWNHFWLNEGWTVWLERKITSKVKNNVEVGRLSSQIGYQHLKESVQAFTGEDECFSQMVWPLKGEDPDHAFSSVPYEKGFNLLNYLETIIGTENFEKFAKAYIDNFKFITVSTGEFRDFFVGFVQELVNNGAEEKEDGATAGSTNKRNKRNKKKGASNDSASKPSKSNVSVNLSILRKVEELNWNALFLTPGMPTYPIDFANSLADTAHDLAHKWISSRHNHDDVQLHAPRPEMNNWSSQQKCLFLEDLLEASTSEAFSVDFLAKLDRAFGFGSSQNSEIMLRWQQLCIRANCPWIYEPAVNFLTSQGRMKFVRPILRELRRSQIGGAKVAEVFEANKDSYHPIARKMLAEDLIRIQKEEDEAAPKVASSPSKSSDETVAEQTVPVTPQKAVADVTVEDDDEADFQDARPLEVSVPTTPAASATTAPVPAVVTPERKVEVVGVLSTGEVEHPVDPKVVEVAQKVVEQESPAKPSPSIPTDAPAAAVSAEPASVPSDAPAAAVSAEPASIPTDVPAAAVPVVPAATSTAAKETTPAQTPAANVVPTKVPEPARPAPELKPAQTPAAYIVPTKVPEPACPAPELKAPIDNSNNLWAIGAVAVATAAIAAFVFLRRPQK